MEFRILQRCQFTQFTLVPPHCSLHFYFFVTYDNVDIKTSVMQTSAVVVLQPTACNTVMTYRQPTVRKGYFTLDGLKD